MNIYIDYTTVEDLEKDIGTYTGAGSYTRGVIRALKDHGADIKLLVYEGFVPRKPVERELMPEGSSLIRHSFLFKDQRRYFRSLVPDQRADASAVRKVIRYPRSPLSSVLTTACFLTF